MKKILVLLILINYLQIIFIQSVWTNNNPDNFFPVMGLSIAAPQPERLDEFIKFIREELKPRGVNTLILRIDYKYQFVSHPELRDGNALSTSDVKKLVVTCKQLNINLIPQINLFGHQSWAGHTGRLLNVYPEFDETPGIKMPENYVWPNTDGLYCKSYCPLHPKVHEVVFALVDEICEVFEATAFHAGMDEVFYIGHENCPRCSGRDKAELFAGEVHLIRNHLKKYDRELWIWGDRLLEGKISGLGLWEASYNNTHRAIDMIPKDVFICDWHYGQAVPTAAYFAMKGFRVATCPWRTPEVARQQVNDMVKFRNQSPHEMRQRFTGMIQTVWSDAGSFLDEFYARSSTATTQPQSEDKCFRALYEEIEFISKQMRK